jgi:hypothetical protein
MELLMLADEKDGPWSAQISTVNTRFPFLGAGDLALNLPLDFQLAASD